MRNPLSCAALGLALIACDPEALDRDATDRDAQTERPGAPPRDERVGPKGPPAMVLVGAALHGDVLDGDQHEVLRPALDALHAAHREVRASHEAVETSALDDLADGRLELADHTVALDELETLAQAEAAAMEHLLATLHDVLDPQQREAVVEAVVERVERVESIQMRHPDGASPPHPAGMHPEALRGLAEALALSDEQIVTIRDALDVRAPQREPDEGPEPDDLDDALDAFGGPDFDPSLLELTTLHPQHVRARTERRLTLLAVLLTVVDDDQRNALVEHLDTRP